MEQVHHSVLDLMQMVAAYQTGPSSAHKSDASDTSDFRRLMEQSQSVRESQAEDKAPEAEADADKPEAPKGEDAPVEESPEVQEQLTLAALAVLQNPVVPIQQTLTPVVQESVAQTAAAQPQSADSPVAGLGVQQTVEAPAAAETPEQLLSDQPQVSAESQIRQPEQVQTQMGQPQADETGAQQTEGRSDPDVTVKVKGDGEQKAPVEGQETPVFQQVESAPIKVGEAPRMEQAPESASVESQVADKLTQSIQNGETRVELQLEPVNLGKVSVELTVTEEGVLHISLKAENSITRGLLERDAANLQTLLGRDTQEVRVEVQAQESQPREDLYDQEKQEGQHQQQQQQRREDRRDGQDFLHQLRLGLIPVDGEAS